MLRTINRFLKDTTGSMATLWVFSMVPVLGGVAFAVDYSNISRLRYDLGNSADATCTVVANMFMEGKSKTDIQPVANTFFAANFDPQYTQYASMTITLPDDESNTSKELVCRGQLEYHPYFGPMMAALFGGTENDYVTVIRDSKMKMKNVAEIALVLDNSGSMLFNQSGTYTTTTSQQRMTLLKDASKKLVTDLITRGEQINDTPDPVKFAIVPFASSVNVGPDNADASWMDTRGISPVHHENLNWGTPGAANPAGFRTVAGDGAKLDASGNPLTRFTLFDSLRVRTGGTESNSQCMVWKSSNSHSPASSMGNCAVPVRSNTTLAHPDDVVTPSNNVKYRWAGCVEARPNGYDLDDTKPEASNPATLFVPMFSPDNFNVSKHYSSSSSDMYSYNHKRGWNDWWPDYEPNRDGVATPVGWTYNNTGQLTSTDESTTSWIDGTSRPREINVLKYLKVQPYTATASSSRQAWMRYYYFPQWQSNPDVTLGGPNAGCSTMPITPLTTNVSTLTDAIDDLQARGGTNSAEGLAWGLRVLTKDAPFTEGSADARKDLDRVVILLTDGANQLRQQSSWNNLKDYALSQSYYSPYGLSGYTVGSSTTNAPAVRNTSASNARVFDDITVDGSPSFSTSSYFDGVNARMTKMCDLIKNKKYVLMTVALDLSTSTSNSAVNAENQEAIDRLTECAGTSKSTKDSSGNPKKLFWNATSATLGATFDEISEELTNLRFTN